LVSSFLFSQSTSARSGSGWFDFGRVLGRPVLTQKLGTDSVATMAVLCHPPNPDLPAALVESGPGVQ
jgi:hypothetical protein